MNQSLYRTDVASGPDVEARVVSAALRVAANELLEHASAVIELWGAAPPCTASVKHKKGGAWREGGDSE